MAQLGLPRSPAGYFVTLFAAMVISQQSMVLFNPGPAMEQLELNDEATIKVIAFCLIAINGYDLIGALQENWTIYWFSLVSRILAATLFYTVGGKWANLLPVEAGGAVILGACVAVPVMMRKKD